jgi:hypothetical protein
LRRPQTRIADYFRNKWDKHRILIGETALDFTKALSEPLQDEVSLFMVRHVCASNCNTAAHAHANHAPVSLGLCGYGTHT